MNTKNITRTAAIIFSEESSAIKSSTIQRKIIESLFVGNDNIELTIDKIIDLLFTSISMDFQKKEVEEIINDTKHSHFDVRYDAKSEENYIKLDSKRLELLSKRENQNSISIHIKSYIEDIYEGVLSSEQLESIIYKYLYELLNKNISAFSKITEPKKNEGKVFIDPNIFEVEEREAINCFLEWNNEKKNRAIFALISYSIEFSVITNNFESSSVFLNSIKNKVFYLDNNVLYRALGINGGNRKKRILTFLKKCTESGQTLKITRFTELEFKNTIKYHIKQLQRVPFKRINPKLFKKYNVDAGVYEYYHQWKAERLTYNFDLFTTHVLTELDSLCKNLKIEIDYKIPFDENGKDEIKKIEKYQKEIEAIKGGNHEEPHYFDAINTFFIESLRGQNNNNLSDTKYFFVSTDQKLRNWDFSRNSNQPVALLPSQWMAILLKYFSRTSDDYSSFVSFLKLKVSQPLINQDNLQTILAGISEITEDFERQETILDKIVELKFEGILNGNNEVKEIFTNSLEFAEKQMDSKIIELNKNKEELDSNIDSLKHDNEGLAIEISELKKNKRKEKFDFEKEQIRFKSELLVEKEEARKDLAKQKIPIDKQAEKRFNYFKFKYAISICLYFAILAITTWKIGWEIMEPITYFLGLFGLLVTFLFPMIFGKDFNPNKYFVEKRKDFFQNTYLEFNLNINRLNSLIQEEKELKNEINELKTAHNKGS